jgi:hypothetical protein
MLIEDVSVALGLHADVVRLALESAVQQGLLEVPASLPVSQPAPVNLRAPAARCGGSPKTSTSSNKQGHGTRLRRLVLTTVNGTQAPNAERDSAG